MTNRREDCKMCHVKTCKRDKSCKAEVRKWCNSFIHNPPRTEKRCYLCKIVKSVKEYRVDRSTADQLLAACKRCDNIHSRERRIKSGYYKQERLQEKMRARYAARYAVKTGKLVRKPCMVCGELKVQGHHYKGYSLENQLKVQWLCQKHHLEKHVECQPSSKVPKSKKNNGETIQPNPQVRLDAKIYTRKEVMGKKRVAK